MNHRGLALAWIGMLAFLLLIAIQPVGLTAQFTFAMIGVLFMCLVRVLRLGGIWIHMLLAVSAAIVFRYIYWRVTDTIPPISDPLNFVFGTLLLLAEVYSVSMLALSFFIVADPIDRPHAAVQNRDDDAPTVDVFVPSYNEDLDIVGTTLAAYLAIYALLLAAYVGVLFFLARKAVDGDVPRPRTPLSGQAIAREVPAE